MACSPTSLSSSLHPLLRFVLGLRAGARAHAAVVIVMLFGMFGGAGAHAGDRPSYSIRVWQREQGLPQNSVPAVTQDRDGYLWVGTWDGLARFDGARFVTFDALTTPALENGRITSLFSAKDGTVWIGHETGNLTQHQAGRFVARRAASTSPNQGIVAIAEDGESNIWILRHSGILECIADGRMLTPPDGITDPAPFLLFARDGTGGMAVARSGLLSTFKNGAFTRHNLADHAGDTGIYGMTASRKGGWWIVSEGMVRRREGDQWVENWGPTPWDPKDAAAAMVELREGTLAVGTLSSGLYVMTRDQPLLHFDRKNGLPHDWVRSIHQDVERNIWVGTGSGGLAMLREAPFSTIDSPDKRNGRSVLAVAPSAEGGIWIGTEGAGIYHFHEGVWQHAGEEKGLTNAFIWSIAESRSGKLWAGSWGGGLFYRDETGVFRREPALEPSVPILSLHLPLDGETMWIGTRSGLIAFNDREQSYYGAEAGLTMPDVRSIVEDEAGTIWFGMVGGGLASISNGVLRQFNKQDGLSSAYVQSLLAEKNGTLWIGTADGGLNRFKDGRFSVIGTKQGLPGNTIGHILDDGDGFLWMSTPQGIFRLAKEDANRCADGTSALVSGQQFGRSDGLPSLEFTGGQNAGCRTADGRLWFSTDAGVVTVRPADVATNRIPPRTLIEEMRIEDAAVASFGTAVQIPPGKKRIDIRYTGLSFAAPEKVKFRQRLKGLEKSWVEAGTERESSYNYLPPGRYQIEVVSCNNDGVWDSTPAVQEFTVLPFFWQTWWFRGLGLLVLLNGAALTGRAVTRRRMKQRVEKAERQHAVERERSRIARDIHDDLGASLTRIALLSQSARADFDHPEEVAGDLAQIYGTAREVTRAMDEIVWAVNPKHDTLDSLATYLGKFAEDFLRAADVRCRLDIPMQLPPWPVSADVRHNVFLACKETLHNIVKHAQASEVRIGLTVDVKTHTFAVTIEDNGRGFDSNKSVGGAPVTDRTFSGNGLANIQTRLAEVGGRYQVETQPGSGTRTSLIVALNSSHE